jgi:SAM-dependent methyltransferase
MTQEITLEDFRRYFPYTPTALAIKECVRLNALKGVECQGPILDVGCGDGLFARLAFRNAEVWGIDIDAKEGRWAQASRAYAQIILGDVTQARLPDGFFGSCVANCSLEHIPNIEQALSVILQALRPDGRFYTFVPNKDWASHLLSAEVLKRLGLGQLSGIVQEAIDSIFVHHHLEDREGWKTLVEGVGFRDVEVVPVGSTASTRAFELFLVPSLIGWVSKKLTSRWVVMPELRRLTALPAYALVKSVLAAAGDTTPTAEFMVSARRAA